jgi:hypothetical protein
MPTIPATPASVRVRIWRRLQAMGAVNLRGAGYVLPNRAECVELFQWLAKDLVALGGQASLCEGRFLDTTADDDIEHRFIQARDAEYAEVVRAAKVVMAKLNAKRGLAGRLVAITEQHAKLARRLAEIIAIDFLDAPGRVPAEAVLAAVKVAIEAASQRGPSRTNGPLVRPLGLLPRPSAATWVTRTGGHVDRIASAWLIRRFIDPQARFKFVPAKGYDPEAGEVRFDMFDAEFTHVGDRCTYEVLVERMGLADPALAAIGEIVHDLDLRDSKYGREEVGGARCATSSSTNLATWSRMTSRARA